MLPGITDKTLYVAPLVSPVGGIFGPTKGTLKKRWREAANKVAYRAYFLLDDGQPNPDWIIAQMRTEFPEATDCQILTAIAHETDSMISTFVRANAPSMDLSSKAAIDDWSDSYHARKSEDFIHRYWPVLRLARSLYYEELMDRDYAEYAENAARKVSQMWANTFQTGPTAREMLLEHDRAVMAYTPFRIETIVKAFKILYRNNLHDADLLESVRGSVMYIPFRYDLDEEQTKTLLTDWDNFVAKIGL